MNKNLLKQMRSEAEAIFNAGLAAIDPYKAVRRFMRWGVISFL